MTAEQMQYNFELKMNTLYGLKKPFQSYDINQFLNKAQDDLVENHYSIRDGDRREHFEADEKLRTELAELISYYTAGSIEFDGSDIALHQNGVFVTMPTDFLYALREECGILYTDCNDDSAAQTARVKPITHDEYIVNLNNSFKKPYRDLVWRMDYSSTTADSKRHELITDGNYTIETYTLRYLRRPNRIDILTGDDCELNSSLHEEIVDRAVRFGMASLPQPENVEQNSET
jgi:hypothetical protein